MFTTVIFTLSISAILAEPQKCCVPWKHSFSLLTITGGVQKGIPKITENILEFNADYTRNMEAFVLHDYNQTTSTYSTVATIINVYNNSTQYMVTPGGCLTRYLNPAALQPRCTPASYKYDGTFTLGSTNPVEVNSWTGPYLNSTLTVALTTDGECTPISERMYGTDETASSQFVSSYLFVNFKTGVINDSLFSVPPSCAKGATTSGKRDADAIIWKALPALHRGF